MTRDIDITAALKYDAYRENPELGNNAMIEPSQQYFREQGFSDRIPISTPYQFLWNRGIISDKVQEYAKHNIIGGDGTILFDLSYFTLWFSLYFPIISQTIMLLSMIGFTLYTIFHKEDESDYKITIGYFSSITALVILVPMIMSLYYSYFHLRLEK